MASCFFSPISLSRVDVRQHVGHADPGGRGDWPSLLLLFPHALGHVEAAGAEVLQRAGVAEQQVDAAASPSRRRSWRAGSARRPPRARWSPCSGRLLQEPRLGQASARSSRRPSSAERSRPRRAPTSTARPSAPASHVELLGLLAERLFFIRSSSSRIRRRRPRSSVMPSSDRRIAFPLPVEDRRVVAAPPAALEAHDRLAEGGRGGSHRGPASSRRPSASGAARRPRWRRRR